MGSLRLASLNAGDNPILRFNYFADRDDLNKCIAGMRKIGEMLDSGQMQQFRTFIRPTLPANRSDDEAMGAFCRSTKATLWHYHGGALVGKVVDEKYRVIGVDSLRVIDGSTFAESPGTNPQATVMMMGRYMGRKINREKRRGARRAAGAVRRRNAPPCPSLKEEEGRQASKRRCKQEQEGT